jgi:hypothetical protein
MGLSVDEIWSEEQPASTGLAADAEAVETTDKVEDQEETVTFEDPKETDSEGKPKAFPSEPATDPDAPFVGSKDTAMESTEGSEFELLDDSAGDQADAFGSDDYELDELEAEIARELED